MDLADALDRELVPKAALAPQKRPELVGDVVERGPSDAREDSEDENASGYFSWPKEPVRHDLSPFGALYNALSQLTTWETVCTLKSATSREHRPSDDLSQTTEEGWRQTTMENMLESLDHLKAVFHVEDASDAFPALLQALVASFRRPSSQVELTERGWVVLTLIFLKHSGLFPHENGELDASVLDREVLSHYKWSIDSFQALGTVFDAERFKLHPNEPTNF